MNFIPNNGQDGFNSYISQDEFFNQSGLSFVPNNDQDGFNSYISQDEFFNQRGPMGGGIGGGSVSTGIGTGSSTSGGSVSTGGSSTSGSVSTGIGTGSVGGGGASIPNLNNSNGLSSGIVSLQAGIPPSQGFPAIPYSPSIPATPGFPAIPPTPAYNPNNNLGLNVGLTNSGTNPTQGCPCEYTMNCWDNNCPSTISTFTGLSSPTCPTGTTEVEPNCIIPATTGSPAIPPTAFVPEQPFVPAIPSSAGTPNTYTMNCWQQMCPSTLNTYSGQTSPVCPTGTQVNEPCLDSTGSSAFSGSGFSGELWF